MAAGIETRASHGRTVYCAVVFDKATGRKRSKTFNTITAAKQWRRDAAVALRAGTMTTDRGPLLAKAAAVWLDALRAGHVRNRSGDPYKPSAIRGYEYTLRTYALPQLGQHRLAEIRPQDVQRLVDRLVQDKCAPATIDSALTPLRALYRRAVARGEVQTNPTLRIEKPAVRCKIRHVATPVEASGRLAALDPADRPLWATAFYAGLRRGELVGLRWEDLDLATGVIHVRRGWDALEGEIAPKSRQGCRAVPIPAVLRDHLVEHRMSSTGEGRVFGSLGLVRGQAQRAGKRWADEGHDRLTLHDARHTYASLMIAAGVNAKALSTFMGHANIAITLDLYGHLMPGSQAEAASLLDAYLAREVEAQLPLALPLAGSSPLYEPNGSDVPHLNSQPQRAPKIAISTRGAMGGRSTRAGGGSGCDSVLRGRRSLSNRATNGWDRPHPCVLKCVLR